MVKKKLLALVVVSIMVVGMLMFLPAGNETISSTSHSSSQKPLNVATPQTVSKISDSKSVSNSGLLQEQKEIELAKKSHVPLSKVFLPNYLYKSTVKDNTVQLGYATSPAPMGVGFYGLVNNSGKMVGNNYTTSSLEASVNMSQLRSLSINADFSSTVTMQLNGILNNVDLFGNSSYVFWTQNVIRYDSSTHVLSLENNIWNFSSSDATFPSNVINYTSTPRIDESGVFIACGPSFYIGPHFNIDLYLNTSIVNGNQALYFNYSATSTALGGKISGTYDEVLFNSSYHNNIAAPNLHYFISGTTLNPLGIPYDAEIMIGGPGGGSNANVNNINATFQLKCYDSSTNSYTNVKSAYDIGSETGETSNGVDVHYEGTTAYLTSGPSMIYGLWNTTAAPSHKYNVQVSSPDQFTFVTLNPVYAQYNLWDYAPYNGMISTYYLPLSSTYPVITLENYHNIEGGQFYFLNTNGVTSLMPDMNMSMGIYTPIYAFNNSQLLNQSTNMNGQYVIMADAAQSPMGGIDTIFGQFNDYLFPVFAGVQLVGTSAPVTVNDFNMPIEYSGSFATVLQEYNYYDGLAFPMNNGMNVWVYNSTGTTFANGLFDSWTSATMDGFLDGTLTLWDSSHITVLDNTFVSYGISLLVSNNNNTPTEDMIVGNLFLGASSVTGIQLYNSAVWNSFQCGPYQIGLLTYASAVNVENNQFDSQTTLCSFTFSIYGVPMNFTDTFYHNYYWNDNGVKPYTNNGAIETGQDNHPARVAGFNIRFISPTNIPNDVTVFFLGLEITYSGSYTVSDLSYVFLNLPGTSYNVVAIMVTAQCYEFVTSSSLSPSHGGVDSVYLFYSQITFNETGILFFQHWYVNLSNMIQFAKANSPITFYDLTPGIYSYTAGTNGFFETQSTSGTVFISGYTTVNLTFSHNSSLISFLNDFRL